MDKGDPESMAAKEAVLKELSEMYHGYDVTLEQIKACSDSEKRNHF